MFKLFKAIVSTVKVLAKVVGALMALQALLTTLVVAFGVKKEAARTNNKVEVQDHVQYTRYDAANVIGVDNGTVACATKNLMGEAMIVTGDVFYTFSIEAQEAIIAHEEGHIALGHLETTQEMSNMLRSLYPIVNKVQPVELEADLYAAKKTSVAQVVAMLEELKTLPGINTRELDLRIQALQK